MEILTHINKRVKHRLEIRLPFLELWKIYNEASSSPMVRNFCIVYIEMSFDRLPNEVSSFLFFYIISPYVKMFMLNNFNRPIVCRIRQIWLLIF